MDNTLYDDTVRGILLLKKPNYTVGETSGQYRCGVNKIKTQF